MIYKIFRFSSLFFVLSLSLLTTTWSQGNPDEGKTLFANNCAACHAKDMKTRATGPALAGFNDRWADFPEADLNAWIRNSQALVAKGHPRAQALWKEWGPTVMTAFPNLTDDQILSIEAYIKGVAAGTYGVAAAAPVVAVTTDTKPQGLSWIWYALLGVLVFMAAILSRLIGGLNRLSKVQAGEVPVEPKSFWEFLTSKGMITTLIIMGVVLAGYTTVKNGIGFGRQQNYQPDQPIKFSHTTHAGLNKIDCQYCHDGARRSKHSVIPAMNTCMNCHKAITKGSIYGTSELSKIFASVGFNPNTNQYIPNYDQLPEKDIEGIFKKWIGDNYLVDNNIKAIDRDGERVMNEQWNEIKSSLTSSTKPKIQGPVEWIRIHSLPDHVYFNHAQHVTVGGIECQQCHGKVETMDVVRQYATLSMGWCVNCHRETEVKSFSTNNYYLGQYEKYHDALKNGTMKKVTVEDIGGLECQKCHY
ncbi:MAG: c-type cytochrome [Saprospiraceae bacterium]